MSVTPSVLFTNLCFITVLLGVALFVRRQRWGKRSQGFPVPPGPRGWPIVGNLLELPSQGQPWVDYHKWSERYGNMMSLNILGMPLVVISSTDIAFDLFEKRSSIYSDRPPSTMDELTGWAWNVALMPYGQEWRSIRRVFHQYFNQLSTPNYRDKQTKEVHAFLRRSLEQEGSLNDVSIRQTLAGIILDVVYGMTVTSMDDSYLKLATQAMDVLAESRMFGAWWVEFMPFLKYVPGWVPGSSAVKYGERWRSTVMAAAHKAFDEVRETEVPKESMVLDLITKLTSQGTIGTDAERHARYASGIAYAAGSDTTFSLLETFFCAMAMFPDIQSKAQRELDEVIGRERLPSYEDHGSLPYIQAIVLESTRWLPVLPLGVVHRLTQDDYYGGYFLPAGTVFMPTPFNPEQNTWAMLYNPKDYPNPEKFYPDRFLKDGRIDKTVRNPADMAFGFGRRICPGRYLALDTAFLMIATVLHTFNVLPSVDEHGNTMDPTPQPTVGFLSYPDRLNVMLKPRSNVAASLVRATQ
ncbi:cytochrome P450 [Trametopsis cervina]|nr:cytochrome P450 [Trametopsis cervina]